MKKIVLLLFVALTLSCTVNEKQRMVYSGNKFILITALLDEYYKREGMYPLTLQEIEKDFYGYLETHPNIKSKYFLESWSYKEVKVPFLESGYFGGTIEYFVTCDRQEYYLWDGLRCDNFSVNINTLQDIRDGKISLMHHTAFIYNGKPERCFPIDTDRVEKITMENVETLFRETKRPIIPVVTW